MTDTKACLEPVEGQFLRSFALRLRPFVALEVYAQRENFFFAYPLFTLRLIGNKGEKFPAIPIRPASLLALDILQAFYHASVLA